MTPLQIAAFFGNLDQVQALVAAGAAIDETNEFGRTALHYAAYGNRWPVEEFLLRAGACPDCVDNADLAPGDIPLPGGGSRQGKYRAVVEQAALQAAYGPAVHRHRARAV